MNEARLSTGRGHLFKFWSKSWTLVCILLVVTGICISGLDLFGDGRPEGGVSQLKDFAGAAFRPTMTSESDGLTNLWPGLLEAIETTIAVAFAAMSLAIVGGFVLGCLASEAFWETDFVITEDRRLRFSRKVLRPFILLSVRSFMGLMRSVHELFWATLGVAIFGLSVTCGILALAIPYAATLGRIYAELIDETERDSAQALRDCGGSSLGVFAFGLLPRAASSMLSYTFYRFDCALRSSAILGFIGFPTLGLSIRNAVRYDYYHEAWTYLYILFFILIATEVVSGLMRRRIAAWR
ncbi:MAG: phosphonate transport system permease protein [Planctomycetota bacterium]|jgi:phosphonate transport system permease protein